MSQKRKGMSKNDRDRFFSISNTNHPSSNILIVDAVKSEIQNLEEFD